MWCGGLEGLVRVANGAALGGRGGGGIVACVGCGVEGWDVVSGAAKLVGERGSLEGRVGAGAGWVKFWGVGVEEALPKATAHCLTGAR